MNDETIMCPNCNKGHITDDKNGWWLYTTGKWSCGCGAHGLAWYVGDRISKLSECE